MTTKQLLVRQGLPASPILALFSLVLVMAGDRLHWVFYLAAVLWFVVTLIALHREVGREYEQMSRRDYE